MTKTTWSFPRVPWHETEDPEAPFNDLEKIAAAALGAEAMLQVSEEEED